MVFAGSAGRGFYYFSMPAHGTDGLRFAHRRAGGGETFLLPNRCHSIRRLPGLPAPDPGDFLAIKSHQKSPGTPRPPYFYLISLNRVRNCPATEFRSFSDLQPGGQRCFGLRPCERGTYFLGCLSKYAALDEQKHLRRIAHHEPPAAKGRQWRVRLWVRGKHPPARRQALSKDARQPRRYKTNMRGYIGGRKPPYAAFWLLFVRTKSNSGYGAEGPT